MAVVSPKLFAHQEAVPHSLFPAPTQALPGDSDFEKAAEEGVLSSATHPRGWLMSWRALSRQIYLLKKLKTPC